MKQPIPLPKDDTESFRLVTLQTGEAAIVVADIPTGRTPKFSLQVVTMKNPLFAPFLKSEIIEGPSKRRREALVLTTRGVRKFLDYLRGSKPQKLNAPRSEEAIRTIQEEILPEMEAMETTVGRPDSMTVGRPSKGMKGSVAIKIGTTSFSGNFLDGEADTISVSWGKVSKTLTAWQLIEVLENHRF